MVESSVAKPVPTGLQMVSASLDASNQLGKKRDIIKWIPNTSILLF